MPEFLAELLDAEIILHQRTSVKSLFFIEVMAGECLIALGVMLNRVPSLRPWDDIYGEDWNVLTDSNIIIALAEE